MREKQRNQFEELLDASEAAVEIAASELGLPVDEPTRPLTVTGGLTFAGGPWNNYVTHAIATMVGVVVDARAYKPDRRTTQRGWSAAKLL